LGLAVSPAPSPVTPVSSVVPIATALPEDALIGTQPTFALGVSHCPWLPDRAANMKIVRPLLKSRGVPYYEETGRAPNNVWSRRLWGWGVSQPVTHGIYAQDDLRFADVFWGVVEAMVRAVPNRIIALIGNHPMSEQALAQGHVWYRCCETLGSGYIVPTTMMREYLQWYDALPPGFAAGNCEDYLLSRWQYETGRRAWCPIPAVIQTQDEAIKTSNPRVEYPFRRSYLDWTDPRVQDKPITEVGYWRTDRLPPDYGYAVSQDTRYPRGLGFSNEAVLAAHARLIKKAVPMNPADRRRNDRLNHPAPGAAVAAPPKPSAPTLRAYPPERDNVRAGIDGVLAGAYEVPGLVFSSPPRILDIGGHVGSATVFFAWRYPGAQIHTYEPSPANAHFCAQNVAGIATLVRAAVVGPGKPSTVRLYDGKQNTGQRSIYQLGEQLTTGIEVSTISADTLPPCEILKADCEGCELEILRGYRHLDGVRAIMLEWHRAEDYRELVQWLPSLGFEIVRDTAKGNPNVGDRNLVFVRPTMQPAADAQVVWQCPRSSLSMIAELTGYGLKSLPNMTSPTILDVGGHVGGFTWAALERWPDGRAVTFEPHPETFAMLKNNLQGLRADAHNAAVVYPRAAETMRLYEGVNGRHECSLRDDIKWGPDASNPLPHVSQQLDKWVDVATFDASMLPPADVMKVDTEGAEIEILTAYKHLRGVRVLITEAHAVGGDVRGQAEKIIQIAQAAGLKWIGPDRIIARFVRS